MPGNLRPMKQSKGRCKNLARGLSHPQHFGEGGGHNATFGELEPMWENAIHNSTLWLRHSIAMLAIASASHQPSTWRVSGGGLYRTPHGGATPRGSFGISAGLVR